MNPFDQKPGFFNRLNRIVYTFMARHTSVSGGPKRRTFPRPTRAARSAAG